MMRGIHPGHCAVNFDGAAALKLFPPQEGGLPAFVQLVNSELRARNGNKKSGCMLQIDQDMMQTLLYGSGRVPNLGASSDRTPLLFEPYTGGDGKDTVENTVEGHSEVFFIIFLAVLSLTNSFLGPDKLQVGVGDACFFNDAMFSNS